MPLLLNVELRRWSKIHANCKKNARSSLKKQIWPYNYYTFVDIFLQMVGWCTIATVSSMHAVYVSLCVCMYECVCVSVWVYESECVCVSN